MRQMAILLLMVASPGPRVEASPLPPLLESAFAFMEATRIDDWSYTVTSREPGEVLVERHVATNVPSARWELVSRNGRSPDRDDRHDYAKIRERRERERREREAQTENILASMIEPGSLRLVSETGTKSTWSFRMNGRHAKAGRFADHLRGIMVVDTTVPYVESAELRSVDHFSAATGVRIDEFTMQLRWTRHRETGAVVPLTIRTKIDGRAFLVKKVAEDSTVVFSDFVPSNRIRVPGVGSSLPARQPSGGR